MTQVVTVSANTAAYAMEALKPAPRVPRKQFVQEAVKNYETARNGGEEGGTDVIRAASAELAMMNFNDHHPHATIQEALEAYRDVSEEAVPPDVE
ncbi:MAG: hypothetical protein BGO05_15325 [Rhizobiales bacterium 63-7]|uniref:hypothetical protein n=1 Tax=Rhizobium sp. YJ-22 TaxID=3037556 RepID=UPI000925D84A|nr:hypothetical protein [Rhizobium sp. YJ-22]MBN9033920.1 hypothetical protein [Hyphomicrobiales bacterium]MDG3575639.1 hypothetical protein [Rhizobium sp. YJ-22]OJU67477.1 MAG: hypothetical protein BGO05_15325 [Rhizobiales bacterium 63-7]